MNHVRGPQPEQPAPALGVLRRRVPEAVLGLGLLSAVLSFSLATLLGLTVFGGLLVVAASCSGTGEWSGQGCGTGTWLRRVGLGTAGLVAAAGVLASTGGAALLMWVAVLGGSWWCLRDDPGVRAPVRPPDVADVAEDLSSVSDRDLCRRWRSSCLQVRGTTDAATMGRLGQERRGYLDELERRHPREFRAWLASAGNPARYLAGDAAASRIDEGRQP